MERVRLQLPRVWLRALSSLDIRPIAGTDGAWSVFWAPDSKSVYFSVKETLKQANVDTGSWRTVKDLSHLTQSGTWLKNGDLLLYFAVDDLLESHPKMAVPTKQRSEKGYVGRKPLREETAYFTWHPTQRQT